MAASGAGIIREAIQWRMIKASGRTGCLLGFFQWLAGRAEIADCAPTLQLFPLQTALICSASTLTLEVSNTISSCKEWCYFSTC